MVKTPTNKATVVETATTEETNPNVQTNDTTEEVNTAPVGDVETVETSTTAETTTTEDPSATLNDETDEQTDEAPVDGVEKKDDLPVVGHTTQPVVEDVEDKEESVLPPVVQPEYKDTIYTNETERAAAAAHGDINAQKLESQATTSTGPKVGRTVVREDQVKDTVTLGKQAREV